MNRELFAKALSAALDAWALQQPQLFISAIRVAQSAIAEHECLCRQLDLAVQLFPSPEVPELLHSVDDALAHFTGCLTPHAVSSRALFR